MNEAETRADLIDPALHEAQSLTAADSGDGPSPVHLTAFLKLTKGITVADTGSNLIPRKWASATSLGNSLPDKRLDRAEVLNLAASDDAELEAVCWSILAWGNMHGRHRDDLIKQKDRGWLELASAVRSGKHTRQSAYDAFSRLRREKKLSGVGPAYFTKLIYFLMPRHTNNPVGYIMDQWVACSINLIAEHQIVLMDANYRWRRVRKKLALKAENIVSDLNDGAVYEQYCQKIETLAARIGKEPDEAELLLMSEGRGDGAWRTYVVNNRQPPHE